VTKYFYILTEGAQDVAFIIKLLKYDGIKQIEQKSNVDKFWHGLIPTTFPHQDKLNQPVPIPKFLECNGFSIAVQSAIGDTKLVETLQVDSSILAFTKTTGICIILDADRIDPQARFNAIKSKIEALKLRLNIPNTSGIVTNSEPRAGIFVLPDNQINGTLENILIECGENNYPDLIERSRTYINSIDRSKLQKKDLEEINKPAGRNKAIVGGVSNILKPGRTLQVSLQDNNWIDNRTIELEKIKAIRDFIHQVIGINSQDEET
jgi:hypothetical protein